MQDPTDDPSPPPDDPAPAIDWSRARACLDAIGDHLSEEGTPTRVGDRMARRAALLAAPDPAAEAPPTRELVAFGLAGVRYALPVPDTAAVIPLDDLVGLPGTDALHLGILVHRGTLVTVVDPNGVLEQPAEQAAPPRLAIVLEHPDCALALAADALFGVVRQAVRPPSAGPVRGGLVSDLLTDGTRVLSADAFARNARLIVDHRLRPSPAA